MKTIILIIFSAFLLTTLSQSVCQNPLADLFHLQTLNRPRRFQNLSYCSALQDRRSCCSREVIDTIPGKIEVFRDSLEKTFTADDLSGLQLSAKEWDEMASNIRSLGVVVPIIEVLNQGLAKALEDFIVAFNDNFDAFKEFLMNLNQAYINTKEDRRKCYDLLLDIQASSYCLACDSQYARQAGDEIRVSPDVCDLVRNTCSPIIEKSNLFNDTEKLGKFGEMLFGMIRYLQNLNLDSPDNIFRIQINMEKLMQLVPFTILLQDTNNIQSCSDQFIKLEAFVESLQLYHQNQEAIRKAVDDLVKKLSPLIVRGVGAGTQEEAVEEGREEAMGEGQEFEADSTIMVASGQNAENEGEFGEFEGMGEGEGEGAFFFEGDEGAQEPTSGNTVTKTVKKTVTVKGGTLDITVEATAGDGKPDVGVNVDSGNGGGR
jgi:hypothetical protein